MTLRPEPSHAPCPHVGICSVSMACLCSMRVVKGYMVRVRRSHHKRCSHESEDGPSTTSKQNHKKREEVPEQLVGHHNKHRCISRMFLNFYFAPSAGICLACSFRSGPTSPPPPSVPPFFLPFLSLCILRGITIHLLILFFNPLDHGLQVRLVPLAYHLGCHLDF